MDTLNRVVKPWGGALAKWKGTNGGKGDIWNTVNNKISNFKKENMKEMLRE